MPSALTVMAIGSNTKKSAQVDGMTEMQVTDGEEPHM
jgi:hypothetical protein